ncbi:hypothetical protein ACTFIZ_012770 [Dictyostelium cf. discoideum]
MVNSNKEEKEEEKERQKQNSLFYKVWGNIVIFKNIFRFVRLYKKNEKIKFKSRKQLLEYSEREFIHSLIYSSNELLEVGDLPIGCVLEDVKLTSHIHTNIHGSKIPFGVERLEFIWSGDNKSLARTQISTFPSSLKTLHGIFLGKDENKKKQQQIKNKEEEEEEEEEEDENCCFIIPSNIKKVYLNDSPNISGVDKGRGYVVLSKGLKDISFDYYWKNDDVCLRKGDFPDGIEILTMSGYQLKNIINKDILPNSIKHLSISYGRREYIGEDATDVNKEPGKFHVLPPNIEKLYISKHCDIKKDSLLNTLTSLKELRIRNYEWGKSIIEEGSLPPNITTLSFEGFKRIEIGIIPISVKHLELSISSSNIDSNLIEIGAIPSSVKTLSINGFITQPEIFPPSLTHLIYTQNFNRDNDTIEKIQLYLSFLPKSITSLILTPLFKDLNLTFPPSITKIEFKN